MFCCSHTFDIFSSVLSSSVKQIRAIVTQYHDRAGAYIAHCQRHDYSTLIKARHAFPLHFLIKNDVKCPPHTNCPQNEDMSICESVRGGTAYPIIIWLKLRTEGYTPPVYGIGMIDEDSIRSEDQRRAYDKIVLKKPASPPGSSELLTADEKATYYQIWGEIRQLPGFAKLMANHHHIPFQELEVLLLYMILKRLETGPGVSQ